jgi:hypothetical protein
LGRQRQKEIYSQRLGLELRGVPRKEKTQEEGRDSNQTLSKSSVAAQSSLRQPRKPSAEFAVGIHRDLLL